VRCSPTELDTPYIADARNAIAPTLDAGIGKAIPDHRAEALMTAPTNKRSISHRSEAPNWQK
jgi:hypothetical protein